MEIYSTVNINESQRAIEFNYEINGRNLVFRFTETQLNDSVIELNVNEIVDKSSGRAEFIWSDEIQNLKLCKLYMNHVNEHDIMKFADELIGIGKRFLKVVA